MIPVSETALQGLSPAPFRSASGPVFLPLVCATWLAGTDADFPAFSHLPQTEAIMQGAEILAGFPTRTPSEVLLPESILLPHPHDASDPPLSSWPMETPPLRYAVASLEHWLDLNA
jgi:hypothetical protein